MATTVIQPQMQQSTVQVYPQYVQQQPQIPIASVPVHLRKSIHGLAISILVLGAVCIVFGAICFGVFGYSIASFTGVNIWVGLMVSLK